MKSSNTRRKFVPGTKYTCVDSTKWNVIDIRSMKGCGRVELEIQYDTGSGSVVILDASQDKPLVDSICKMNRTISATDANARQKLGDGGYMVGIGRRNYGARFHTASHRTKAGQIFYPELFVVTRNNMALAQEIPGVCKQMRVYMEKHFPLLLQQMQEH